MHRRFLVHLLLLCTLPPGAADAANLRFLKDTPASKFDNEDAKIFQSALQRALRDGKDGDPVAWSNEKTGGQGSITPIKSYQAGGRPCRDLRIANSHSGLKAEGTYQFCRNADKRWTLK